MIHHLLLLAVKEAQRINTICCSKVVEQLLTRFLYQRSGATSSHLQTIRQAVNTNSFIFFLFFSSWKVDRRIVGSDFDLRSGTRHDLIPAYRKCSPGEIHQHVWVSAASSVVSPFSGSVSGCDVTNCDVKTRTINFKMTPLSQGKRCSESQRGLNLS